MQTSALRRFLCIALALASVIGLVFSIRYNLELKRLRHSQSDLRKQVGFLDVEDPAKVAIAYVPVSADAIPPGVTEAYVWKYRMHIPANYGPCYVVRRGLVTADSPQGSGGSSSSWSGQEPEPQEVFATLALIKADGDWLFCRTTGGGSSTSHLPKELQFDSLDDLVVEPIVAAGEGTRSFDSDEAICLLRLRKKELAKKRNGRSEKSLYRGFVAYTYGAKHKDAFNAWARGTTDSMRDAKP